MVPGLYCVRAQYLHSGTMDLMRLSIVFKFLAKLFIYEQRMIMLRSPVPKSKNKSETRQKQLLVACFCGQSLFSTVRYFSFAANQSSRPLVILAVSRISQLVDGVRTERRNATHLICCLYLRLKRGTSSYETDNR